MASTTKYQKTIDSLWGLIHLYEEDLRDEEDPDMIEMYKEDGDGVREVIAYLETEGVTDDGLDKLLWGYDTTPRELLCDAIEEAGEFPNLFDVEDRPKPLIEHLWIVNVLCYGKIPRTAIVSATTEEDAVEKVRDRFNEGKSDPAYFFEITDATKHKGDVYIR